MPAGKADQPTPLMWAWWDGGRRPRQDSNLGHTVTRTEAGGYIGLTGRMARKRQEHPATAPPSSFIHGIKRMPCAFTPTA